MKTLKNFWYALFLLCLASPALTSCGDDDGGTLSTPQFESVSGKYTVTTPGSQYKSIELGASGNYIVMTNSGYRAQADASRSAKEKDTFLFHHAANDSRATNYNGIIYGTYTQLSDGRYNLEGFGIIEIIYGSDNTVTGFELTPENGGPVSLTVSKEETMPDDDVTNALCRTWEVESIRFIETEDGETFDITLNKDNSNSFEDAERFPEEVLFSKSGTYMIYYTSGEIGISSWKWKNKAEKSFFYSWNNQWYDDEFATVSFSGNRAIIYECYEESGPYPYKEEDYTYLIAK